MNCLQVNIYFTNLYLGTHRKCFWISLLFFLVTVPIIPKIISYNLFMNTVEYNMFCTQKCALWHQNSTFRCHGAHFLCAIHTLFFRVYMIFLLQLYTYRGHYQQALILVTLIDQRKSFIYCFYFRKPLYYCWLF